MKSKITLRLIFTNLLILIVALFCFNFISIYNLNSQARSQAEKQIFAESSVVAERTEKMQDYFHEIDQMDHEETEEESSEQHGNNRPNRLTPSERYIFPSQNQEVSFHIFCERNEDGFMFPEEEKGAFGRLNLSEESKAEIANLPTSTPTVLSIHDELFLVLLTPYNQETQGNNVIVSLLAMAPVNTITSSNIFSFSLVMLLLIILSFGLIYWQSMGITAPLKQLTFLSQQYAKQDYSTPFTLHTGDEIESLSHSIQTMVESIIDHEKAQTALFRNLSHELKTPLSAISGYAQNIQNGYYENPETPLTIIQEESQRIRDILDDLIFLSKIDSHVEDFSFASHDLVEILTTSIEKVESIAILKDIDILYEPPSHIMIPCDKEKLMRAFINILSNALKHTKDQITIQVKETKISLSVVISDNGDGFDQTKLEKLFLSSTGETVDGNGIGLLIVYEIIKRHGGSIAVKNQETAGAEVTLHLPKPTKTSPELSK